MFDLNTIRNDLKNIRYYMSRKDVFEKNLEAVGSNDIAKVLGKYNLAVRSAPPRLYDLYVSLYLNNNTQESLADIMGYSCQTISRLNIQLIKHFQKVFNSDNEISG